MFGFFVPEYHHIERETVRRLPKIKIKIENYKQFFIEQNVDEYIALCTFLDITPNVEMYIRAVGYYMFMNNNLLVDK